MEKLKGIVFGKGFLGTRLAKELNFVISDLRISDKKTLDSYLDKEKPNIIINAIGKTGRPNVDWCESHKEETIFSNVVAPIILCTSCSEREIYFVHLGSGCIYYGDNDGKGFSEEDEPNFYGPQFYAKTKILSEKALREFPCLQLRLRMPIDNKSHQRNLIDKLKNYSKLINIQNSMTTVPHLIEATKKLIEKRRTGIYNITNPGTISAAEIMRMYKETVDPSHSFEIMSIKELDRVTLGKRSNCKLNTDKLQSEGIDIPEIHKAVRECLLKYKNYLGK
jgi:dTDP-4-dehydrorhamnose reductase